jgi:hypothetical protein
MMPDSNRLRHASIVVLTAVFCAVLPSTGWTWGGVGHTYIAQHYSQHLPADLDGLRTYDTEVAAHVSDADTRKGSTHGESERHYIDIDYYHEFLEGTLPRSRSALEALYGPAIVNDEGVLPWTIEEVVTRLTQQFQARQWSSASLTIADLCHYVGDANQPLHCTVNYDGWDTGNGGIHSRHESTMITSYLGQLDTPAMSTTYCPSPLDAAFDVIAASWAGVSPILTADNVARAAAGGSYNSTYYASLWNNTHTLTQARLDTASVMTASLVYTAWVNAGEPAVGEVTLASFEAVPQYVSLTWFVGAQQVQTATVERRDNLTDFVGIGDVTADAGGRITFTDDTVSPGGRYAYRLAWIDDGTPRTSSEVWVDVPAMLFTLRGAQPNPASRRDGVFISLALPDARPATLELLDVAGRQLTRLQVEGAGEDKLVDVSEGLALEPGIYLVRLTHGGRSLTRRVTVVPYLTSAVGRGF